MEDYNERKISLCYGLKLSATPAADFDVLMKFYIESKSSFERKEILSALGCVNDPQLLSM